MPHDDFNCFVFNDKSYHSENHYLLTMSFSCQVTDKYSEWMLSDYCFTEFLLNCLELNTALISLQHCYWQKIFRGPFLE